MDKDNQANQSLKSTTTDVEHVPLHLRIGSFTTGGYPQRHYRLLSGRYDETGSPWLEWPEEMKEQHHEARSILNDGDCMLILIGPRGTGKTQLATELALDLDCRHCSEGRPLSHMYSTLSELFNSEKASWKDPGASSPLEKSKQVDLLVLDEIQEVVASDWEKQALTLLIDDRYRNMKRTIMIGNLTKDGLGEFFSKSISSRVKETGLILEMAGKRYR